MSRSNGLVRFASHSHRLSLGIIPLCVCVILIHISDSLCRESVPASLEEPSAFPSDEAHGPFAQLNTYIYTRLNCPHIRSPPYPRSICELLFSSLVPQPYTSTYESFGIFLSFSPRSEGEVSNSERTAAFGGNNFLRLLISPRGRSLGSLAVLAVSQRLNGSVSEER